ncbi:heme-binding protein [Pseudomonas gingeri]|uniref:Heme-binding protein n=1 Tax=Pseudomonas gingeri TaxID=117681 RepID=A0A7Y7XEE0_9PSED|nr:heme-binding protein [Pseudomonas gingeri]NWB98348.1 heme-binding protein [Pseudomonas gingeri]NWD68950.1 heme-binding protein [Pseudomonas gingeri]
MTVQTITTTQLSLDAVHELLAKARQACAARGFAATIAVTDSGGHLQVLERADNVPFLTVAVATDKAWTAASFGMSTSQWNQYMAEPTVAPLAHHPRLTPVGGGVPIIIDGQIAGGIGISGGSSVQDHEAAEEALRAMNLME